MSSAAFASTGNRREPITQASVQKMLDENTALIHAIIEFQNQGNAHECVQYQQILHRNLIFLATLADSTINQQQQQQPPPLLQHSQQVQQPQQTQHLQQPAGSMSSQQQQQAHQQQQMQHYQQHAFQQQQMQQQQHQQLQQHMQHQQLLRNNALNNQINNNSPNGQLSQIKNSSHPPSSSSPNVSSITNPNIETNKTDITTSGRSTPVVSSSLPQNFSHINQPGNTNTNMSEKNNTRSLSGYSLMPNTLNMHSMSSMQSSSPPFIMTNGMSNGTTPDMLQNMLMQQQIARASHEGSNYSSGVNMLSNSMSSSGF